MSEIAIDLKAKGDTLAMQNATDRLKALRDEIDKIRSKGEINLTVGDTRNLGKLSSEANILERQLTGVHGKMSNVNAAGTTMKGVFAGIVTANVVGQLTNLGKKAVSTFIELGKMGEESAQLEAKFTAIAGGAGNARDRFNEMDAAVGNWLTRDAKMEASTRIMSLGLADSAEAAGELARTAIMLGDSTQTAESRIQTFTQMLATGQTRGLADFGISVLAVRARVEELTAADETLSTSMATQQAITEAAAARMQELGDFMPITETETDGQCDRRSERLAWGFGQGTVHSNGQVPDIRASKESRRLSMSAAVILSSSSGASTRKLKSCLLIWLK